MIYNCYFKKIKLAYLLPLSLIAMFFLFTVGQSRGSDKYSIRVGGMDSYVRFVESTFAEIDNFALIMSDYMPSSIVLTRSFEYLDKNNEIVHNPARAIIILLSPIPMLPSIASDLLFDKPVKELSSAFTITSDYVKTVRKTDSGMGTHVVADIYFSWGVIGVIVFFFLFGKLVAKSQKNSLNSVKYAIVFFTVVSFSIYMPRDTLYSCFRLVCYQLFILWILSSFNKRQCI